MNKQQSHLLGWYNLLEAKMPLQKIPKGPITARLLIFDDHIEVEYFIVKKNRKIHRRLGKYDYLDLLDMDDTMHRIMRVKQ